MATLKQLEDGQLRPLPGHLLVGRGPACALRINDRHVSGEHATLIWTPRGWVIRDLGSRNGTFVDGIRLGPGEPMVLAAGTRLGFGSVEHGLWELIDAGPPSALAERLDSKALRSAKDGILALPSGESPELLVFADQRGRWVLEGDDGDQRRLDDGEVITAGGHLWRILLPDVHQGTATIDAGPTIDTISLRFGVSRDEEHVELTIIHRGKETKLEAREHAYTLLTLARARLDDASLALAEQGWLERDQLMRMLGTDGNSLNVAIYRARGQLGAAGVEGAAGIVEVRRGQRRFGLEPARFEVVPL